MGVRRTQEWTPGQALMRRGRAWHDENNEVRCGGPTAHITALWGWARGALPHGTAGQGFGSIFEGGKPAKVFETKSLKLRLLNSAAFLIM
jgi:hypothetical protein